VPEGILRIKQEIDTELHGGEDQSWVRNDSIVSSSLSFIYYFIIYFARMFLDLAR
jgi:hypothetical protein